MKLEKNWKLVVKDNYWNLQYEATKLKEVKGVEKEVTSTDNWYAPHLPMILEKFTDLYLKESETVEDLKERMSKLETILSEVPKVFVKDSKPFLI